MAGWLAVEHVPTGDGVQIWDGSTREYSIAGKGGNIGERLGLTRVDIAEPFAVPWMFAVCWKPYGDGV